MVSSQLRRHSSLYRPLPPDTEARDEEEEEDANEEEEEGEDDVEDVDETDDDREVDGIAAPTSASPSRVSTIILNQF